MVTMIEVARLAGVSQSTVSHVLNRSRRVSPATERAVLDAIEETGYVADSVARSLRTGRSGIVGLVVSAITNPFFSDVVHFIEREVTDAGLSLLLVDPHDEPVRELRVLRELLAHRPDGIIIAPSDQPDRALGMLARREIPVVMVDRAVQSTAGEAYDAVVVESLEATARLVACVADAGHRRIGFIAPRRGLTTTEDRISGYRLELERRGIPFDDDLLVTFDPDRPGRAIRTLLAADPRPTAAVIGNNQATMETLRALQEMGVGVPDGVSIACFDDFVWADIFSPRLTTVRQPVEELGRRATELLLSRIADPSLPPRRITLEPTLQIRESIAQVR